MQDDLKKAARSFREAARRIRPHPVNPFKIEPGTVARFVDVECADIAQRVDEAADRIADLEAKLAEKDALLRECGEALDGMLQYSMFNDAWQDKHPEYRTKAAATFTKIKDATNAD